MARTSFYPQYKKVVDLLKKRILSGAYTLKTFPSERRLGEELGVNYMTVRRAIRILSNEKVLVRESNGRLRISRAQHGKRTHFNFCFLSPSSFGDIDSWRWSVQKATSRLPCTVRPIFFMNWDDPIILDCLQGFDGVFLYPPPAEPTPEIIQHLRDSRHPVVVLNEDLSAQGIPSVQLFPAASMQKLLDHLASLGHTNIGCINTQPPAPIIQDRINQWRYWMASRGFKGHLADSHSALHEDLLGPAYQMMKAILADPIRKETAWVCITTPPAMAAISAMHDKGIRPGHDMAICSVNGEGIAAILNPGLTSLEAADPGPFLSICIDWMMAGGGVWPGPLLMRPAEVPLIIRDSTQPGTGRGTLPVNGFLGF